MQLNSPILFIEINQFEFLFIVVEKDPNNNLNFLYNDKIPLDGIRESKIQDFDLVFKRIKDFIYKIEQKLSCLFKETILVINNFDCFLINFSGFKNLNGSQLDKENISFILNSLKSKIQETEKQKTIIHIFNSNYILDKKIIQNLPLGLFGDFYSQELSFFLMNSNDYKNLKNIFNKCNLRINKIISKNFLEGAYLIKENSGLETFFKIEINENNIEIIFFENSALKYSQKFKFGSNLILNDISKVTGLEINSVKNILLNSNLLTENNKNEIIEKNFFSNQNFRKIKKSLIFEIAKARIEEIAEIIITKNANIQSFLKKKSIIFLNLNDNLNSECFKSDFEFFFSNKYKLNLKIIKNFQTDELYKCAFNLVHYGWKKEAVPIVQEKKSFIARFFDIFFK